MAVFWTMFWLSFLGMPLIVLLAGLTRSSGFDRDSSHIWVDGRSGKKTGKATVRDVWRHNHPGQKWEDHQTRQVTGCSVVLGIVFIGFLAWLAAETFLLPQDRVGLRLFWQIGAPILGAISAGAFYLLQTSISNYKSNFLKTLHIFALVVMGLGVIGALVLTFLNMPLPISNHWLWVPVGAMMMFVIMDSIGRKAKTAKAQRGGSNLEKWVHLIMTLMDSWDYGDLDNLLIRATVEMRVGNLDRKIRNQEFFDITEGILLDLIQGNPMSIGIDEVYRNRASVIKAVQDFYFYMVNSFQCFALHPKVEKAINQQK